MRIKWLADFEKKYTIKAPGIASTLHFRKGDEVDIPDEFSALIKRKMSDAFSNKYCTIISSGSGKIPVHVPEVKKEDKDK